jgi:Uma2 family endonuclease
MAMVIDGLTIEEFEQLPNALARNHELVDGILVDVSENTGGHHCLRDALLSVLGPYVRQQGLGRVICGQAFDFDGNAHGPDVSLYGPSKAALFDAGLRVQRFVPDLAIEIASKGDRFDALFAKALHYRRCGTAEVWIFSILTRQAFVFSEHPTVVLVESQDFQSPLIPGFSIRLSDLFAMI